MNSEGGGEAKQESTAKNTHVVMSQDGLSKQKESSLISFGLSFSVKTSRKKKKVPVVGATGGFLDLMNRAASRRRGKNLQTSGIKRDYPNGG